MNQLKKDLEMVSTLLDGKKLTIDEKKYHGKIYLAQTENSKKLYRDLSENWTNSLFIGGSGDQPINSILYGCKNLIITDINHNAIYFILLKIAAIQALDYEEFLSFFLIHFHANNEFKKIKDFLDKRTYYFWKTVFTSYKESIIREQLFFELDGNSNRYMERIVINKNPYLNENSYRKLKEEIKKVNIEVNFLNIQDLSKKLEINFFDKIYLSNIILSMGLTLEEYWKFLQQDIIPLLNDYGELMAGYFNLTGYEYANLSNLGTTDEIIYFFKQKDFKQHLIFDDEIRQLNSALVYQKTKKKG